jgi:hypothetical protein
MDQGPERGGKRSLGLGQVRLHAAPPSPLREIYHRVQNLQQREKEEQDRKKKINHFLVLGSTPKQSPTVVSPHPCDHRGFVAVGLPTYSSSAHRAKFRGWSAWHKSGLVISTSLSTL